RSFQVRGGDRGGGAGVPLRSTIGIWIDTLTRAIERWLGAGAQGTGAIQTQVLRLTAEQSAEMVERINALFEEYDEVSESNDPEVGEWETYWAHLPRVRESR